MRNYPRILVDDISPRSLPETIHPRLSVDLGGTDLFVHSVDLASNNRSIPDLAVLEELESIRGMIENKSRDLFRKEMTLSKSIDKWNLEVLEAQKLIEELAGNLSICAETKLQEKFGKCERRVAKLADKVALQIEKQRELQSKCVKGPADVPPLPQDFNPGTFEDERIIEFISHSPSSIPRLVAAASLLLARKGNLTETQLRFSVNSLFISLATSVAGRFDKLVRQAIESEPLFHSGEMSSKFTAAKQSFLKKRLGLPTSDATERITLLVKENLIGNECPVDIAAELDEDMRKQISDFKADDHGIGGSPMVRLFANVNLQISVCMSLRATIKNKGIKCRCIELLLIPMSDRAVLDSLNAFMRDLKNRQCLIRSEVVEIALMCILLVLHRSIEDARSSDVSDAACDLIDAMLDSTGWSPAISRFLTEWIQGQWFVLRTIIAWKGVGFSTRVVDSLLSLLKLVECSNSMIAWRDIIIEKLNHNQINQAVVGHAKGILKLLGPN